MSKEPDHLTSWVDPDMNYRTYWGGRGVLTSLEFRDRHGWGYGNPEIAASLLSDRDFEELMARRIGVSMVFVDGEYGVCRSSLKSRIVDIHSSTNLVFGPETWAMAIEILDLATANLEIGVWDGSEVDELLTQIDNSDDDVLMQLDIITKAYRFYRGNNHRFDDLSQKAIIGLEQRWRKALEQVPDPQVKFRRSVELVKQTMPDDARELLVNALGEGEIHPERIDKPFFDLQLKALITADQIIPGGKWTEALGEIRSHIETGSVSQDYKLKYAKALPLLGYSYARCKELVARLDLPQDDKCRRIKMEIAKWFGDFEGMVKAWMQMTDKGKLEQSWVWWLMSEAMKQGKAERMRQVVYPEFKKVSQRQDVIIKSEGLGGGLYDYDEAPILFHNNWLRSMAHQAVGVAEDGWGSYLAEPEVLQAVEMGLADRFLDRIIAQSRRYGRWDDNKEFRIVVKKRLMELSELVRSGRSGPGIEGVVLRSMLSFGKQIEIQIEPELGLDSSAGDLILAYKKVTTQYRNEDAMHIYERANIEHCSFLSGIRTAAELKAWFRENAAQMDSTDLLIWYSLDGEVDLDMREDIVRAWREEISRQVDLRGEAYAIGSFVSATSPDDSKRLLEPVLNEYKVAIIIKLDSGSNEGLTELVDWMSYLTFTIRKMNVQTELLGEFEQGFFDGIVTDMPRFVVDDWLWSELLGYARQLPASDSRRIAMTEYTLSNLDSLGNQSSESLLRLLVNEGRTHEAKQIYERYVDRFRSPPYCLIEHALRTGDDDLIAWLTTRPSRLNPRLAHVNWAVAANSLAEDGINTFDYKKVRQSLSGMHADGLARIACLNGAEWQNLRLLLWQWVIRELSKGDIIRNTRQLIPAMLWLRR